MKLVTYQSELGPRVAGIRDGSYVDLNRADPEVPACIKALLAQWPGGRGRAIEALAAGHSLPAEQLTFVSPVPNPEKIICVGLNYMEHAKESGASLPEVPVIFNKLPTTVSVHGTPIVLPKLSSKVDYEAELVVVIGRGGRRIKALSIAARKRIAKLSGRPCQLFLTVDVAKNWTRDPSMLDTLGYRDRPWRGG